MGWKYEKRGFCPTCSGIVKPCRRCQVQEELDELRADLRKLVDKIKHDHSFLSPGLDRYTANKIADEFKQRLD